jgi:hypothetical protein
MTGSSSGPLRGQSAGCSLVVQFCLTGRDKEEGKMSKLRIRLIDAVYSLVLVSGIGLVALSALATFSSFWRGVFLNLGTELIGAFVLFVSVYYFGFKKEVELSEKVEELVNVFEGKLRAGRFFGELPDLAQYISSSSAIDLCGVTLTSTIEKHLGGLAEAISDGADVRLLIVDPESLGVPMSSKRSEGKNEEFFQKKLSTTFDHIRYLHSFRERSAAEQGKKSGKLEVRLLEYAPSFAAFRFKLRTKKEIMVIEYYPHKNIEREIIFEISSLGDKDWLDRYVSQFEKMWRDAKPWDPASESSGNPPRGFLQSMINADSYLTFVNPVSSQMFTQAENIDLGGMTLGGTVLGNLHILKERINEGASIRAMMIEPKDDLLAQLSLRSEGNPEIEFWKNRIFNTQSTLRRIAKSVENSKIQVGFLPYLPSFGIVLVDATKPTGKCIVEMYHHKSSDKANPKFILEAVKDKEWFEFFAGQFEKLWDSCRIEKLG